MACGVQDADVQWRQLQQLLLLLLLRVVIDRHEHWTAANVLRLRHYIDCLSGVESASCVTLTVSRSSLHHGGPRIVVKWLLQRQQRRILNPSDEPALTSRRMPTDCCLCWRGFCLLSLRFVMDCAPPYGGRGGVTFGVAVRSVMDAGWSLFTSWWREHCVFAICHCWGRSPFWFYYK